MRKTLLAILTMASIQLFADRCDPCPQFCPPCPPQDCAYNAPYRIDLPCQWDLFVTGSFIWWEAKEENLSLGSIYSLNTDYPSNPVEENESIFQFIPPITRKLKDFEFQYCPGFQVGIGYNIGCDNWKIYGEYTYLRSNSSGTIGPEEPSGGLKASLTGGIPQIQPNWYSYANPLYPVAFGYTTFTKGSGKWDLDLDIADFQLSREYFIGKCLTFRSYASLRAAWIDQKFNAIYEGDFVNADYSTPFIYDKTATTKCWGVGPRVGLDTDWFICSGFRIFANSGASLLYTKYSEIKDSAKFNIDLSSIGGGILVLNPVDNASFNNQPCYIRPQADITLGAGWATDFCSSWYFDLEIGYTFNIFWSQNMFMQSLNYSILPGVGQGTISYILSNNGNELKGGDLTLQGLVLKARLDF